MAASPDRRALLLASLAIPAIAVPALAQADEGRTAWIAALDASRAAAEAHEAAADAWRAADDRLQAIRPELPEALVHRMRNIDTGKISQRRLTTREAVEETYPGHAVWYAKCRVAALAPIGPYEAAFEAARTVSGEAQAKPRRTPSSKLPPSAPTMPITGSWPPLRRTSPHFRKS